MLLLRNQCCHEKMGLFLELLIFQYPPELILHLLNGIEHCYFKISTLFFFFLYGKYITQMIIHIQN